MAVAAGIDLRRRWSGAHRRRAQLLSTGWWRALRAGRPVRPAWPYGLSTSWRTSGVPVSAAAALAECWETPWIGAWAIGIGATWWWPPREQSRRARGDAARVPRGGQARRAAGRWEVPGATLSPPRGVREVPPRGVRRREPGPRTPVGGCDVPLFAKKDRPCHSRRRPGGLPGAAAGPPARRR
jgi:hypothetical protein